MEIINRLTSFIKDQSGGKTVGDTLDNGKKTIATLATIATIANASPTFSQEQNTEIPNPKTTISQETQNNIDNFKTLTPITTAEDIYESYHWNQGLVAEYYNAINPNDKSKYLYLGLPSSCGLKGDASLAFNNSRAVFYKVKQIPEYLINGIMHKNKNDTAGLISIPEGIKNNNQFAKIELGSDQEGFYTIKVTGTDDRINKKNLYLNAIVFKDEVNVTNNEDFFRTRIVKRVAYKYALGTAMGKGIKLENGQTLTQDFELTIPKEEQAQCKIVIFGQDRTTGQMYFSGYMDMIDGEPALFNVDNLPSSTIDLKNIEKFTTIDDIEINTTNLPQYQEKMGYQKKVISVTNAKDLKYLSLQLDYTATEAQIYDVITAGLNPDLKNKATLKYDPVDHQVNITFTDPINGDKEIFNFYIKINETTNKTRQDEKGLFVKSTNFKFKEFEAYDSNYNLVKYNLREQKTFFPVRMCTIENFDFNKDTNVNSHDLEILIDVFGSMEGDKNWNPEYDIYKESFSEGRIDIGDIVLLLREINKQNKIIAEIKAIDPKAPIPELAIDIYKLAPHAELTGDMDQDVKIVNAWISKIESYKEIVNKINQVRKKSYELTAV